MEVCKICREEGDIEALKNKLYICPECKSSYHKKCLTWFFQDSNYTKNYCPSCNRFFTIIELKELLNKTQFNKYINQNSFDVYKIFSNNYMFDINNVVKFNKEISKIIKTTNIRDLLFKEFFDQQDYLNVESPITYNIRNQEMVFYDLFSIIAIKKSLLTSNLKYINNYLKSIGSKLSYSHTPKNKNIECLTFMTYIILSCRIIDTDVDYIKPDFELTKALICDNKHKYEEKIKNVNLPIYRSEEILYIYRFRSVIDMLFCKEPRVNKRYERLLF